MREADWIAAWVTVHIFAGRKGSVNVSRDKWTGPQPQLYNQTPPGAPGCCSHGQVMKERDAVG